jgi:hypothetical protein
MFGNWLVGIDNKYRILIRVGVLALIWSLWLCRNNLVFDGKHSSPLQAIHRCTSLLHLWLPLQCMKNRELFMEVYTVGAKCRGIFLPDMDGSIVFGSVLHSSVMLFL